MRLRQEETGTRDKTRPGEMRERERGALCCVFFRSYNTLYTKLNYDIIENHMIKPLNSQSLSVLRSDRNVFRRKSVTNSILDHSDSQDYSRD